LAGELCQLARARAALRDEAALDRLLAPYALALPCSRAQLQPLLEQSIAIAQQYCSVAGIDGRGGVLVEGLDAWCRLPVSACRGRRPLALKGRLRSDSWR